MHGKTIMSWNVPAIQQGDPQGFVNVLVNAGFQGVCLKCADGVSIHKMKSYSPWPDWGENIREELVVALKAAKLKVYLWQFVYGYNPSGELSVAINQTQRFKPDGYIWDVEGSFDGRTNAVANARLLTKGLKTAFPDLPQSFNWWALPRSPYTGTEWHPVKVADAFLEETESVMPMMYWQGTGASAAVSYLNKSLTIWRNITDKPIIPVGRTYNGDGGTADAFGIKAFGNAVFDYAKDKNLIGCSWWNFDSAIKYGSWMVELQNLPKFPSVFRLTTDEILDRLIAAHKELFPELEE